MDVTKEAKMELLETRELREWYGEPLPEGFCVYLKYCDEWEEPVIEIWRRAA